MDQKPSRYVRTTITVPKDLKRRMLRVRAVNWSAVACQAFEAKLSDLLKRKEESPMFDMPPMDDAINRLRRLKSLPESAAHPHDFESGFRCGRRWAMATATPKELGRLEAFSNKSATEGDRLEGMDGKEVMRRIAQAVTEPGMQDDRRRVRLALREFWPVKVGLEEKPSDYLTFARGFCEGAMGFWSEAKDKI